MNGGVECNTGGAGTYTSVVPVINTLVKLEKTQWMVPMILILLESEKALFDVLNLSVSGTNTTIQHIRSERQKIRHSLLLVVSLMCTEIVVDSVAELGADSMVTMGAESMATMGAESMTTMGA